MRGGRDVSPDELDRIVDEEREALLERLEPHKR